MVNLESDINALTFDYGEMKVKKVGCFEKSESNTKELFGEFEFDWNFKLDKGKKPTDVFAKAVGACARIADRKKSNYFTISDFAKCYIAEEDKKVAKNLRNSISDSSKCMGNFVQDDEADKCLKNQICVGSKDSFFIYEVDAAEDLEVNTIVFDYGQVNFEKVGCFKTNKKKTKKLFGDFKFSWNFKLRAEDANPINTFAKAASTCARFAKQRKRSYFSIIDLAKCYVADDDKQVTKSVQNSISDSSKCFGNFVKDDEANKCLKNQICVGSRDSSYIYKLSVTKVDGGFNEWSEWSECSTSCGDGFQNRNRKCNNPPPSGGGRDCEGEAMQKQGCNLGKCPVHGGFGKWSDWSQCSTTCGKGIKTRNRLCNNPPPSKGGKSCEGGSIETKECNLGICPIHGGFSKWSDWSQCSTSCGYGIKKRKRKCNNPPPSNGGKNCEGSTVDIERCNLRKCPIHGGFSKWSEWSKCSTSCGKGIKARSRKCNNPPPSRGGNNCEGQTRETQSCNLGKCPIHGGFSKWSKWTKCSTSCGNGIRTKERKCNNPPPSRGGKNCEGESMKTKTCNLRKCPIHGGFGKWSRWTKCSTSCGNGIKTRNRKCNNPSPSRGGRKCEGQKMETTSCNLRKCPIHGGFGKWSDWSKCSTSCGIGIQTRNRKCNNPPPSRGGKNCEGQKIQTKSCNLRKCPIHGGFGKWSSWSKCSTTCGNGFKTRNRKCNNPPPSRGGRNCEGQKMQTKACNLRKCPTPGPMQKRTKCQNKKMSLTCKGKRILIRTAMYGRLNKSTCVNSQNWVASRLWSTSCKATTSLQKVRNLCEKKKWCSINASDSVFGDPCPWTEKYLTVQFQCI